MDKPYDSQDQHFNLPHIRSIGTERPMQWLRMGWNDMRENLGASLSYGVILAAIGYTDPGLRGGQALPLHGRDLGLHADRADRRGRAVRESRRTRKGKRSPSSDRFADWRVTLTPSPCSAPSLPSR